MRLASQKFVGEHDFRNFCKVRFVCMLLGSRKAGNMFICKMDVGGGVTNFRRRILSFQVDSLGDNRLASDRSC